MAAKKTAKKQVSKQKSTPLAIKKQPAWWAVFAGKPYTVRVLGLLAYTAVVAVLVVVVLHANGWHGKAKSGRPDGTINAQSVPVPLAQNTLRVHACSDSIASIASYTYSAKYFFDLKQQGYHLAGTLSQQASDGRDFTDADCATYFGIRATYPASHIILQLFTQDASGNLLPYQYKDLKPDTCYSSDTTHRTVCPYAPKYGIFAKD